MILPESRITYDVSPCDTSFLLLLRRSLLRALNECLRGVASQAAQRNLQQARNALRAGALDAALRNVDRVWRCVPDDAASVAPIYGRLLVLEGRDYEAARGLLQQALKVTPDPDIAALLALSLLRLQRHEDAQRQLEAALGGFCVVPGHLLFHVAGIIMRHPAIKAAGWLGRGQHLELLGELACEERSNVLDISLDGYPSFTQLLRLNARPAGSFTFRIPSPKLSLHAPLTVSNRGVPLMGSGTCIPADFGLDGRVRSHGRHLIGWARIGWLPNRPVHVRIEDEDGHRGTAKTDNVALPRQRWPFRIGTRAAGVRGSHIRISARLPDGSWQPLPDSPLLLERGPFAKFPLGSWRASPRRAPKRNAVL